MTSAQSWTRPLDLYVWSIGPEIGRIVRELTKAIEQTALRAAASSQRSLLPAPSAVAAQFGRWE